MDRIHNVNLPFNNSIPTNLSTDRFQTSNDQTGPCHRIFIPLHYEKNYAYPLLVWLHGPTGSEVEISQVMPHISLRNFVGLSPRGVVEDIVADGRATFTWDQQSEHIEYAADDILKCIEVAKQRYHIADNRVFLAGYDAGGTMALRLALQMPEQFAGAISLGGELPRTGTPLADVRQSRSLPLMIAQCRDSVQYTTDDVCRDLRLLHSAGIAVTLRQYPCVQEVTTQMLADVNNWVMEQVTGTASGYLCDDPTHLRLEDHN